MEDSSRRSRRANVCIQQLEIYVILPEKQLFVSNNRKIKQRLVNMIDYLREELW